MLMCTAVLQDVIYSEILCFAMSYIRHNVLTSIIISTEASQTVIYNTGGLMKSYEQVVAATLACAVNVYCQCEHYYAVYAVDTCSESCARRNLHEKFDAMTVSCYNRLQRIVQMSF